MPQKRARQQKRGVPLYDVAGVEDAPEHYEYSRAMGLLTWGTWQVGPRPFEERLKDFLQAFPPESPICFQGSVLVRNAQGEYTPGMPGDRLARFQSGESQFGAVAEALARYGLRLRNAAAYVPRSLAIGSFRDVARLRNVRLRRLHGSVDVEAENMDAAKTAELERLEKKQAAEQIREARERMRRDHEAPE
jgi:hypothetical protein